MLSLNMLTQTIIFSSQGHTWEQYGTNVLEDFTLMMSVIEHQTEFTAPVSYLFVTRTRQPRQSPHYKIR